MKARVIFATGDVETFLNLTEIHYNYPSPIGNSIAFESDVESTGCTYPIAMVEEFEVVNDNEEFNHELESTVATAAERKK